MKTLQDAFDPNEPDTAPGCPEHGPDGCEPDDHIEPPTVDGEVI